MRIRRPASRFAHLEVTRVHQRDRGAGAVPAVDGGVLAPVRHRAVAAGQELGCRAQLKVDDLKLEVVIRPDALDVGDRIGGLIQHIPNNAQGYDLASLSTLIQQVKAKFPDTRTATVLAQPNTSYDVLVHVMDSVREGIPAGVDPHARALPSSCSPTSPSATRRSASPRNSGAASETDANPETRRPQGRNHSGLDMNLVA